MTTTNNTETYQVTANDRFNGDFEFLPLAASIECGPVPTFPTGEDFQLAAMVADKSPAHRWHCEAIRYRRANPGAMLDGEALKEIARGVADSLYKLAMANC